ncbi:MAG: hypothetical protein WD896_01735 [Parcubacteria group bacterium]
MKIDIKPRYGVLIILFFLLVTYSSYQARALIIGPRIWITSPEDGSILGSETVILEGQSKNIAWISLNGRQIFTDENGEWSEKLLVSPGTSIMTVRARDRFGRETEERIQIILN